MNKKQHTLGFLLARASSSIATYLNCILKKQEINLPHSQYIVLKYLYNKDGISQQQLANRLFKDTAAIKRTLDILEKKGLAVRVPITLRKNSVKITNAGKKLIPKVMACVEKSKETVLAGISKDEYNIFAGILEKIYQNTK